MYTQVNQFETLADPAAKMMVMSRIPQVVEIFKPNPSYQVKGRRCESLGEIFNDFMFKFFDENNRDPIKAASKLPNLQEYEIDNILFNTLKDLSTKDFIDGK